MYLVYLLFVPLVLWFLVTLFLHKSKKSIMGYQNYDYKSSFLACYIIAFAFSFIVGWVNLGTISNHKGDFVEIEMLKAKKNILQHRADTLMAEFKEVLVKDYPEYEKEVFGNMAPDDLQILFVRYPEIKNNLVATNYVQKIQEFLDEIYNKDLRIEELKRDIDWRYVNPWIFSNMLPNKEEVELELSSKK